MAGKSYAKAASGGNVGADCTHVRSLVAAFFDWAGYSDCRRRAAWETIATRRVLDGENPGMVAESVKQHWYSHRRALGLPMRIDQCEPTIGLELFGATLAILEHGLKPAQAAVLFRSLEREHPGELAVTLCREMCEQAGSEWRLPDSDFAGCPRIEARGGFDPEDERAPKSPPVVKGDLFPAG
jgi:hypothetical protein